MTTNTTNGSLVGAVEDRIRLKATIDDLVERLATLDADVIAQMQEAGLTKVETVLGKINLVQNHTVVWNEEVLKELLSPSQWKRVIVEKIDKARLDAEIVVGRIDGGDVEVAKSIKQSKPFLR